MGIAIIAALAGLLGAAIGGGASYLGTRQQIEAQQVQAELDAREERAGILASERRKVYVQFVQADQELTQSTNQLLPLTFNRDLLTPDLLVQYTGAVNDSVSSLGEAETQVSIIGTNRLHLAAQELYRAQAFFVYAVVSWATSETIDGEKVPLADARREVLDRQRQTQEARGAALFAIREEIRLDLAPTGAETSAPSS